MKRAVVRSESIVPVRVRGALSFALCGFIACMSSVTVGVELDRNIETARLSHEAGVDQGAIRSKQIEISTEIGKMRIELYPDKAPKAVAALIELARSGYYETDTVMESRPDMGFVIAKIGESASRFEFTDDASDLVSRRGSVAISKASVTNAYLNNIFFGYNHQPELQRHYVIIGQVLEGLDQHERAKPAIIYKVNGFSVVE